MRKISFCAALAVASLTLNGCATVGIAAASDAISRGMMPDPEVLTAASLGTTSDNVVVHGDVDFEGGMLKRETAVWTASLKDNSQLYKCEYTGDGTPANCVATSG